MGLSLAIAQLKFTRQLSPLFRRCARCCSHKMVGTREPKKRAGTSRPVGRSAFVTKTEQIVGVEHKSVCVMCICTLRSALAIGQMEYRHEDCSLLLAWSFYARSLW